MKNLFLRFWPILFLLLVFLLLFYKVFFLGQVLYEGDNFHLNIPTKYFLVDQVLHGHLPLWNPYLFLGIPYLADFNLGTLNPTNIFYFIFPVPRALTILTVFDFFGLGVGMYLFLRSFSLSKTASLLGAVVMSLGGMPFALLGNMTFMQVVVYIPFLFLLLKKFSEKRAYFWLLLLVLVQFLQIIAGHPQETYYTMLSICFYLFFFSPFSWRKRFLVLGVYIVLPVLLSSMQLVPFVEYVLHANRQTGSLTYAGWGGLTLSRVVTFIFPTFYGSHLDGTWWGPQQVLIGFLGIPTLVLFYIGVRFVKLKDKWFYLLGALTTFLLAWGLLTPLFYIFYYLVPGWRLFRAPSGVLVFFTFFSSILASFGLEYLKEHREKFVPLGKVILLAGLSTSIFSGVWFLLANRKGFWQHVLLFLQQHTHLHAFSTLLFYDSSKLQQMFQGILWNVLFASIFLFLTGTLLAYFSKKMFQPVLLLFLVTLGFLFVNPKVLLMAPLSFYSTGSAVPFVLHSSQEGKYRILSIPVNLHQERQHLPPANYFYTEGQANLAMYQYDNNIERGLYQVAGYVSLVPASFSHFIGAKDAAVNVTNIDFSKVTQRQLNLSSVRFVTSHEPIKNYSNNLLPLVAKKPGDYYIYENTSALPRAYVLENPYGNTIVWKTVQPTVLSFSVSMHSAAHVILSDWYYPGWKALVNGKEVKILPYMNTFQQIRIPKGVSTVQVVYDPISVKVGLLITLVAALLLSGGFVLLRGRKI